MRHVTLSKRNCVFLAWLGALAIVPLAASQAAQPPALAGEDIKTMVSGATVHLHGPMGTVVPVKFSDDGTMKGRAGMASFFLGASRDSGKWWVTDNRLCKKWRVWFKGRSNCLEIRRKGMKFHWRDGKGESGWATIASRPVIAKKQIIEKKFDAVDPPVRLGTGSRALPRKASKPVVAARLVPASVTPAILNKNSVRTTSEENEQAALDSTAALRERPSRQNLTAAPSVDNAATQTSERVQLYKVVGVPLGDFLYVRTNPTKTSGVLGKIPSGAGGIVLDGACRGSWCPVMHPRGRGWINKGFVEAHGDAVAAERLIATAHSGTPKVDTEPTPGIVTRAAAASGRYAPLPTLSDRLRYRVVRVRAGDVLNMRRGPSAEAGITGTIAPGAGGIRVTSPCSGVWCPVAYGNRRGWVNRTYIAPVRRTSKARR